MIAESNVAASSIQPCLNDECNGQPTCIDSDGFKCCLAALLPVTSVDSRNSELLTSCLKDAM